MIGIQKWRGKWLFYWNTKYRHKGAVTDITRFTKKEKDEILKIERMLSCSADGLILFLGINKMEIKEKKEKNNLFMMNQMHTF